jgi:hypothetical protein
LMKEALVDNCILCVSDGHTSCVICTSDFLDDFLMKL